MKFNNIQNLKLRLVKLKKLKIIYITPTNQLWGILDNGSKKFIAKKIIDIACLNLFIRSKKLISYKESKKFKKVINSISKHSKELDQFYTIEEVVNLCITWYCQKVHIDKNLDLIIEPSAGNGSFFSQINSLCDNRLYLDLDPKHFKILKNDFLNFEIKNQNFYENIHIIGNPPFKKVGLFVAKACKIGNFIGFVLPRSFKKDSLKKKFPLNFHCIFSKELPKNSFKFEGKLIDIPTIFQVWEKKNYDRNQTKKLESKHFFFVKKEENPCLSFQRVGSKSGMISFNLDKSISSHYFLQLKKGISLKTFVEKYNSEINFLHDNTVGPKSISKQELIYETNKLKNKA